LSLKDYFSNPPAKASDVSFSLRNELLPVLSSMKWNVKGILLEDNSVISVPAESRAVTAILQSMAVIRLKAWAKKKGVELEDLVHDTRGYPDLALTNGPFGSKLIAIDIKSARHGEGDDVSRMTLGTYDGYFLHPSERKLHGGERSYNDYSEHWVVGFIYDWNPTKKTSEMVNITDVVVGQKWQFASRSSGSGDTANMGGVDSLQRLRSLSGDFASEREFEKYWRDYAVSHPRKRTRKPK
jgi:hypothetical protein